MTAETVTRTTPASTSLARRWRVPVAGIILAGVGAVSLLIRDPHRAHTWGACPFHSVTGYACPGCGSMRGLRDLLTGHPVEAVGHNLLLIPALVWLVWWWIRATAEAGGHHVGGPPSSAKFCYALLVILAVFTVARNLPGSPLAP